MSRCHDELRRTSGKCATRNKSNARRTERRVKKKCEARKRSDADGDRRYGRRRRCVAQDAMHAVLSRAMIIASAGAVV